MTLTQAIDSVREGKSLGRAASAELMSDILRGGCPAAELSRFLVALREKGESLGEIAGFIDALAQTAVPLDLGSLKAVDNCGTGGDGLGTFNVSTTVAFVVAGAGVPVAKHGNRSSSSRSGSADVLEILGVKIDLSTPDVARSIEATGFVFLLAPRYHPRLAAVAQIRRQIGGRTVFNLLGPLINPARVERQIVGVSDRRLVPLVAQVLRDTGSKEAMVCHGCDGMDEFTLSGPTFVAHLKSGQIREYEVTPQELGLSPAPVTELAGGEAARNAQLTEKILRGEETGPRRDVVLFNAAMMLQVAGCARDPQEGLELARKSLGEGAAMGALEKARNFR